ncbi:MAG: nucleoside triphosphate pyrophosphohydrolase [Myxococcota bacterium]|nr:nucleoside triphosphate pyrophosphohydrolase [Myxococcota bacterium]
MPAPQSIEHENLAELLRIMAILRGPNGCPWDRDQTLSSLKSFLLEETYEVLEAIDGNSATEHQEELGDLLFQVVFQSQIQWERGYFNFNDVAGSIVKKLRRRHPHIFGCESDLSREQIAANWRKIKLEERLKKGADTSAIAGVPRHLPALFRSLRLGQKAAAVGFDWETEKEILDKLREELDEFTDAFHAGNEQEIKAEFGDLLFTLVNIARHLDIDPEEALQKTNETFESRFRRVEKTLSEQGMHVEDRSPEQLDILWRQAKKAATADS